MKRWFEQTENKICNSKNLSSFYKYSKKKLRLKNSEIPPLRRDDGTLVIDDTDKANFLNETFQSIFITDDGKKLQLQRRTTNALLVSIKPQAVMLSKITRGVATERRVRTTLNACCAIKALL